jgi:hypothetical protein
VVLVWRPPRSGAVTNYRISRDGLALGVTRPPATRYVDEGAAPGATLTYEVVVVTDGLPASEPAVVRIRTPLPPLKDARLVGVFNVKLRRTSTYGISDVPEKSSAGWRFRPECSTGPCDVRWTENFADLPALELTRDGARYEGSATGKPGVTCGGTESTGSYSLVVRVVAAELIAGVWQATKIEGTWSYSVPAQLGCRSGGTTWEGVGRWVG